MTEEVSAAEVPTETKTEKVRIRLFSKAWFLQLLENEATSGLVMIFAMIAAIVCANTAAREPVHHFLETTITIGVGNSMFPKSIEWWVNDVLMVFFFLSVGLELKREMKEGFFSIEDWYDGEAVSYIHLAENADETRVNIVGALSVETKPWKYSTEYNRFHDGVVIEIRFKGNCKYTVH